MSTLPPFRTGARRAETGTVTPIEGIEIPYAVIEGAEPGPCLLVTAGVHGSEFCSIEAALRLMRTSPDAIRGSLVVLPTLNVEAFFKRAIYVMPQDGKNLNRQFPGRADGTLSERLAHWLTGEVFPQADAYIDMHGGDLDESLAPFTIFPHNCERSRRMAEVFGLDIAIASRGGGYSVAAAHEAGVPAILPEVSGNGLWDDALVTRLTDGVAQVMALLGMTNGEPKPTPAPDYVTMWVPAAPVAGLWYPAKGLREPVAAGETLGVIRDFFGADLATVTSEKEGYVLYTLTSLSVNAGEALLGVGSLWEGAPA
ncbi:succinylglutamate desuccinylase/aspartoacylase family protein [Aurantimonas sp. MSK8Z-1]|uniref:succinylglutamate desuccinylase/aspartoacylase family protein n=1 Tax=Mangrovibrevibacter kandeliae TaxID=2968473 RepID=UPI00211893E3|nr:succinylglutamate desuccinylase/aspartoacylase family protein [Aurantimonas sp. MSK8Z-1]MCW4116463.1 succinylglutamate desuccinylase/aspartoacylase family protein [Aurantimonas sp. MSK8Z-1]